MSSYSGYCAIFNSNLIGSLFFGATLSAVIVVVVCASSCRIFHVFWPKAKLAIHLVVGVFPAMFFVVGYTCTANFKTGGWIELFSKIDSFPYYILAIGFLTGLAGLIIPAHFGAVHRGLLISYSLSTGAFSAMLFALSLN